MAAAAANHSHRAGRLKQQNKKNKRSAASKRSVTRRHGGKINALPTGASGGHRKGPKSNDADAGRAKAKANRANAARQRREAKRKGAWDARRGLGAAGGIPLHRALASPPPRIVGIISLSELEGPLEERVRCTLMGGADRLLASSTDNDSSAPASVTAAYPAHAKGGFPHLTLLTNATAFAPQYSTTYNEEDASVQGTLDLCRVADTVLFLMDGRAVATRADHASSISAGAGGMSIGGATAKTSATTAHLDHLVSARGDRILAAVKAQGVPTPVTVVVHADEVHEGNDAGGGSVVGRHVGGGAAFHMGDDSDSEDEAAMEDDEEGEALASLPGTLATHRSAKSLRRSRLRQRSELKRYAARFAATEFGEHGRVVELDVTGTNDAAGAVGMSMAGKMDGAAFSPRGVASAAAGTTATSATASAAAKAQASAAALVRLLCTASASGPNWVADAPRPYLVADGIDAVRYDKSAQELEVTGYIRGNAPWNCNRLVHVPHVGTYAVKHIKLAGVDVGEDGKELLPPILAAGRKVRKKGGKTATMEADDAKDGAKGMILAAADPEERESLAMFASPDALEGEQNLIGFDDDDDVDDADRFDEGAVEEKKNAFQPGTARPAGWSDYQSAWLDALDPDNEEEEDRGELAFALNKKSKPEDSDALMDDDDADVDAEEKRLLLAARKKSRADDLQFPDEVDCEEEGSARDRYARYRALTSFRKSHWDPKENLPEGYGAVYHFGSFRATQRDVLGEARETEGVVRRRGWGVNVGDAKGGDDDDDVDMAQDSDDEEEEATARACVPPGAYVTITLEGVAPSAYAGLSPHALATAVSLLPHENKVSVLHAGLSPSSGTDRDDEIPVKSKDVLTFRCGWRTWQCRPIFSQLNLNSDKHKFERYMPSGGGAHFAATVYGPATYAPCPVLVFREAGGSNGGAEDNGGEGGRREFLAHGSMLGADADRIVLKRIVLTGYPTRVHKRHATVKYMFYNPDDVRWFMPAGLSTKHGLQGNIVQSVGDHGVMKCLFNAPIKQHDTVCLPLYKRVYPKFAPVEGEEEGSGKHFRVL